MTPDFKNALTSPRTRLSLIRFRTRASSGVCSIWSKHAWMSASSTHSWKWLPKKWISAIASMRAAVRPEPVRARHEVGLEDGFQYRLEAGLNHPVCHGRDPQLTEFPARLRNRDPPHLHRLVLARLEQVPDLAQKHLHPATSDDLGHRDPIHARGSCPGVGRHPLPRVHQERRVIDQVEQVAEPASVVLTRPTVQFELRPSYRPERRIRVRPLHSPGIHRCIFEHRRSLLARHAAALPQVRGLSPARSTTAAPPPPRRQLASGLSPRTPWREGA